MQKNIMQIKSEQREADTFIFKDNEDNLLLTYPLFLLLIFSQGAYMFPSNTCQINNLSKDLDVNPFLNYFYKKFMKFDFESKIQTPLINKTKDNIFRNDFANHNDKEGNLLSIINLFNFNSEVNQNIDLSCGGFKSFDVVDVTCDDYLTKYFETLRSCEGYRHMLYYKNWNISRQNGRNVKLVTGLTNFCGETLRKELMNNGYYLSVDGKIYKIRDDVRKFKLVQLLLLNTVRGTLYGEMNAFEIDNGFMGIFGEEADNLLNSIFDDADTSEAIKSEYKQKNIKYNTENKRFEMKIGGRSYDATGWIYTKIEQMLIDQHVEGKYFFGNKPNNQGERPLNDDLYNQIMSETTETHSAELLKLIENTAKVFDCELKNGALDIIKFSPEEEEKLKKAFYDKTPLELFFKNPKKIADLNKAHTNNADLRHRDIAEYVLENGINSILTEDGKNFFEKIKSYLSEQNLITQDLNAAFGIYKYDANTEFGNQNQKSKIEFSFITALIECFQCGNDVAYGRFNECLGGYLNYFFYNQQDGLSKKASDENYKKLIKERQKLWVEKRQCRKEEIHYCNLKKNENLKLNKLNENEKKSIEECNQRINEYKQQEDEFSKKGKDILKQVEKLEAKFLDHNKLEVDEWKEKKSQTEEDILAFKCRFIGFDENIIKDVFEIKRAQFAKDNGFSWGEDAKYGTITMLHEFKTYLSNFGTKTDYKSFCLCLNCYLQEKKIDCTRLMDGVEEDNKNKDIGTELNFKIIKTLMEYKKRYKEESENNTLLDNFRNNKQIMDIFHLLEFFIYAAYMAANECDTKIKAEVASNASDLQFFMYTNPDKLVNLITSGKQGVADTLLSFLLKNTGLETDKKVINGCKTKVCRLMERTVNVAHMTQLNLVKFDTTNNNRKYKNLIMYKSNGILDFCLAPLQTVDKINNSNILNTLFNPGLNLIDPNENCDLILNPDDENSKLKRVTDVEALDYLSFDRKELIETSIDLLKDNSYLFWLCLRKKPELLLYNDENGKESNILFKLLKTLKPDNNLDNDFQVINDKYMPVIYCLLDMKDQKMSLASVSHLLKCMKVCSESYLKQAASRPNEKLDQINFIELAFKAIEKMYFNVKHFPENHEQVVGLYKDILDSLNSLFTDELTKRAKKLDDLLSPEQQKQMFKYCYVLHEKISTDERYGQWIQSQEENLNWIGDDPIVNAENVQMDDFIKYLMENKFQNICLGFNVDNLVLTEDISKKLKAIKTLFEHFVAIKINQKGKEDQNKNIEHIKAFFESLKSLDKQDYEEQIKVWLSAGISENNIIQKLCLTVDDIDVNAESLEFFVEFIPNHPEIDLGTGVAKSLLRAINQMFKIINDENNQHNNDKAFLNMLKDKASVVSDMAIKLVGQMYTEIIKNDNDRLDKNLIDKAKEYLQALKLLSGIPDSVSKIQTLLLSDDPENNIIQELCLTVYDIDVNAGSLEFFVDFISKHPEIKLSSSVANSLWYVLSRAYNIVNDNNHRYHNNEILVKLVRDSANVVSDIAMKFVGQIYPQIENNPNGVAKAKGYLQVFRQWDKIPDGINKLQTLLLSDDPKNNIIQKLCSTVVDIDVNAGSLEFFIDFISHHPEIKLSFSVAKSLLHTISLAYIIVNSSNHQYRNNEILVKLVRNNAESTFDFAMKLIGRMSVQLNNDSQLTSVDKYKERPYFNSIVEDLNNIIQFQNGNNDIYDDNNAIKEKICQDYKDLLLWLYLLYKKAHGVDLRFYENSPQRLKDSMELNDNKVVLGEYKVSDSIKQIMERNVFWKNCQIDDFINWLESSNNLNLSAIAKSLLAKEDIKKQYLVYKILSVGDVEAFNKLLDEYPDELNKLLQEDWNCIYKLFTTQRNMLASPQKLGELLSSMRKLIDAPGINIWPGEFQQYVYVTRSMLEGNDLNITIFHHLTNALKAIDKVRFNDNIDFDFKHWNNADGLKSFFCDFNKLIGSAETASALGYNGPKKCLQKNKSLILKLYVLYKRCLYDKKYYEAHKNNQGFMERVANRPRLLNDYSMDDSVDQIKAKDVFYENDHINDFEKYLSDNKLENIKELVKNLPEKLEASRKNLREKLEKFVPKLQEKHSQMLKKEAVNTLNTLKNIARYNSLSSWLGRLNAVYIKRNKRKLMYSLKKRKAVKIIMNLGKKRRKNIYDILIPELKEREKNLMEVEREKIEKFQKSHQKQIKANVLKALNLNISKNKLLREKADEFYNKNLKQKTVKALKNDIDKNKKAQQKTKSLVAKNLAFNVKNVLLAVHDEKKKIEQGNQFTQKSLEQKEVNILKDNKNKQKAQQKIKSLAAKNLAFNVKNALLAGHESQTMMDKLNELIEQFNESETKLSSLKQTQSSLNQANKNQSELLFQRKIEYTCLGLDIALIVLSIIFLKSIILIASTMALGVGLVAIGYFVYKNKEQYKEAENKINNLPNKSPEKLQQEINDIEQSKDNISAKIEAIEKNLMNPTKTNNNFTKAPKSISENNISVDIKA